MAMATARSPILQDDQKFALMKFRRSVADVLKPEHDDFYLLRWLRARSWNPDAAETMLRNSVKWRERWDVDNILSWKPSPVLIKYVVHGVSGFDREGSPVIVIPFGPFDMWGILHTVTRGELIRYTIQNLEKHMKLCFEQSQKHGIQARQVIAIFDMENFNIRQYAWRPAAEVVIQLVKMYEANYPEILKCCYIINAPKVFAFAFNMVKRFLGEYTISKIQIYKSDKRKWSAALLKTINEDNLPEYYGGTLVDKNGDPKCQEFINWGGKVPPELYSRKNEEENSIYKEGVVKKGHKMKLHFECKDHGCFLKWEFRIIEHDIRFGVKCKNNNTGEENLEIELKQVAAHELDEIGFITCQPHHTYTVVFDNSYSYLRSKKIRYNVILTDPLPDKDILEVID